MDTLIDQSFGRYNIREHIRDGYRAAIYKAFDQQDGRVVALKIYDEGLQFSPSMLNTINNHPALKLNHANIAPIYDIGVQDGRLYIAMQYYPAGNLQDYYTNTPTFPVSQSLKWLKQIGNALDYAHAHEVLHLNIKPENILLDSNNNPILTDFNFIEMPSTMPAVKPNLSNARFITPEQTRGNIKMDVLTDQYQLGVLAYLLLGGRFPFNGADELAILQQHQRGRPIHPSLINSALPQEVNSPIQQCLSRKTEYRIQAAVTFTNMLEKFIANRGDQIMVTINPHAMPDDPLPTPPQEGSSALLKWSVILMAVILIGIIGFLALNLMNDNKEEAPAVVIVPSDTPTIITEAITDVVSTDVNVIETELAHLAETSTAAAPTSTSTSTTVPTETITPSPIPMTPLAVIQPTEVVPTETQIPTITPTLTLTLTLTDELPIVVSDQCVAIVGDSVAAGQAYYQIPNYGFATYQRTSVADYIGQYLPDYAVRDFSVPDAYLTQTSQGVDYFTTEVYQNMLNSGCDYVVVLPWVNQLRASNVTPISVVDSITSLIRTIRMANSDMKIVVVEFYYIRPAFEPNLRGVVTDLTIDGINSAIQQACQPNGVFTMVSSNVSCLPVSLGEPTSYLIANATREILDTLGGTIPIADEVSYVESFFAANPAGEIIGDGVRLNETGKDQLAQVIANYLINPTEVVIASVPPTVADVPVEDCITITGDSIPHGLAVFEVPGHGFPVVRTRPISDMLREYLTALGITNLEVRDRSVSASYLTNFEGHAQQRYYDTQAFRDLMTDRCRWTIVMPWFNDLVTVNRPTVTDIAADHVQVMVDFMTQINAVNPNGRILLLQYYYGAPQSFTLGVNDGLTHANIDAFNAALAAACESNGAFAPLGNVDCMATQNLYDDQGTDYVVYTYDQNTFYPIVWEAMSADVAGMFEVYFRDTPGGIVKADGMHLSELGKNILVEALYYRLLTLDPTIINP